MSPDSLQSHQRFKEEHGLPFPLIADTERKVIRLYEVQRRLLRLTQRVSYLIDKAGDIRGVFHHEVAIGSHQRDVLEGLRRLVSQPGSS